MTTIESVKVPPAQRFLYFDTGPLRAATWPRISGDLGNLFAFATYQGVGICIPEAVMTELDQQWTEAVDAAVRAVVSSNRALHRVAARVGVTRAHNPVDATAVLESYRTIVTDLLHDWNIHICPITSRSVAEVFEMAARRRLPFDEKGSGFKDAVILLSVLDHLAGTTRNGVLVTKDGGLAQAAGELVPAGTNWKSSPPWGPRTSTSLVNSQRW